MNDLAYRAPGFFRRSCARASKFGSLVVHGEAKTAFLKTAARLLGAEVKVGGFDYVEGVRRGWAERTRFYPVPADAQLTHPDYPAWRDVPPLPPLRLMHNVGAPSVENFYVVGEAWSHLIRSCLKPESSVLDVGCGCGRTARFLLREERIRSYLGVDIVKYAVDWSNRFLAPLSGGRFRFLHLDVKSEWYNPQGKTEGRAARLPVEDGGTDIAVAASLFTHLREEDAENYLREARRVLKPGGGLLLSLHAPQDKSPAYSGDEFCIRVNPAYFQKKAEACGLSLQEARGEFCGQLTYVYRRG